MEMWSILIITVGIVLIVSLYLEEKRDRTLRHELAMAELEQKTSNERTRLWAEMRGKHPEMHWPQPDVVIPTDYIDKTRKVKS